MELDYALWLTFIRQFLISLQACFLRGTIKMRANPIAEVIGVMENYSVAIQVQPALSEGADHRGKGGFPI